MMKCKFQILQGKWIVRDALWKLFHTHNDKGATVSTIFPIIDDTIIDTMMRCDKLMN